MRIGSLVCLLAVEKPLLVAVKGDIKGVEVWDIIWVEVAKVGVKLSTGDLGAWLLEARFGESVVDGTEVEMDALPLADAVDVGWVKDQFLVWADKDRDDWSVSTVDSACLNIGYSVGRFFRNGIGRCE